MAKIYKVSGYLIDVYDASDKETVENFLYGDVYANLMSDMFGQHVHVEEAEFEWEDDNPLNKENCDLADCEKYFPLRDTDPNPCWRAFPSPLEIWRHFKGKEVTILAIATHSENTHSRLVIYNCHNGVYARPLDMFMSKVDREKYPDAEQEYRFERVR